MQVAEEADETSVRTPGQQYMRGGRLGAPFGFDWISVVVASLKIAAVEMKVICILACQYGVGLRAGGNQHDPRRQRHGDGFGGTVLSHRLARYGQSAGKSKLVHFDGDGREVLGATNAFFQRFFDLL